MNILLSVGDTWSRNFDMMVCTFGVQHCLRQLHTPTVGAPILAMAANVCRCASRNYCGALCGIAVVLTQQSHDAAPR